MKTTILFLLVALFAFANVACVCVDGCEPVEGLAFQTCEAGSPIRFATLPIRVEVQDDRLFDFTVNAVETWNADVGFEVFTMDACEGCPVVVVSDETNEQIIENTKRRHGDNTIAFASSAVRSNDFCTFSSGYVRMIPEFWDNDFEHKNRTMVHELGHVLGIQHEDNDRNTLMNPTTSCSVVDPVYAEHISSIYR